MTKTLIKKKLTLLAGSLGAEEGITILLCFSSLFAKFNDLPMCVISLLLLQLAKGVGTKFACLMLSVVTFGVRSIHTAYYIPYMGFMVAYFVTQSVLERTKLKPVHMGLAIFILSKIYVLSFRYNSAYWVLFVLEVVGLAFLPSIVGEGIEIVKFARPCKEANEIFSATAALLLLALSVSGIRIWGVNPPAALLLCLALSYGDKSNASLSLLSVLSMFFCLSQSQNFAFLFAGFLVIYLVGTYISKHNIYSYIALCLFALGVSVLFLVKFNSFIFLTTTAISLVGYFLIDKFKLMQGGALQPSENLTGEKDYNALMSKLEKLNRSFRFLGNTVIDISNLLKKEDVPEELEGLVCQEVCKNCKSCTQCWQENYGDTQSQFARYGAAIQRGTELFFDDWFVAVCTKTDKLRESFERSNQLLSTKVLIGAAGRQSQRLLQNQFLTLSQTLQEITHESQKSGIVNTAFTHTMSNFLIGMGRRINYCLCYQNNNKLVMAINEPLTESDCCKIAIKLESLYCSRFSSSKMERNDENYIYTFLEVPMFSIDFHCENRGYNKVCGDSCETLQTDDYFYILLSDGMGTGSFAAAESKTAISMLKSLLGAAVKPKTAIDIVNIALNLKGTGQSCVSVDILQVNLYNGECQLTKAGAAASLLLHATEIHTIYKDSLPIGILKDTNVAQSSFTLTNGDTMLLMSDGVTIKNSYMKKLKLIGGQYSSRAVAQYIIESCEAQDDITVAAIKLIRV